MTKMGFGTSSGVITGVIPDHVAQRPLELAQRSLERFGGGYKRSYKLSLVRNSGQSSETRIQVRRQAARPGSGSFS